MNLPLKLKPLKSFENFIGHNWLIGQMTGLLKSNHCNIWIEGGRGCGKTHLAQATIRWLNSHQKVATYWKDDSSHFYPGCQFFIVDDAHLLQNPHKIYELVNQDFSTIIFSAIPVANLTWKSDIKTRLGIDLKERLNKLSEEQKHQVLKNYFTQQNWMIGDDAIDYLLERGPRNLKDLIKLFDQYNPKIHGKKTITKQALRYFL